MAEIYFKGNKSQLDMNIPLPESYWIGQELDWESPPMPVVLSVELPFWIMVPNCLQEIEIHGHVFKVEIRDDFVELYVVSMGDSRSTCAYMGPPTRKVKPELEKLIKKRHVQTMYRKCKTVLRIYSACNKDVLVALNEEGRRFRSGYLYIQSFCEAHLELINYLIQHYRLSTYDFFAYEVSPWDIPIWFVKSDIVDLSIILLDYAEWDEKPIIHESDGSQERYKLIEPDELKSSMLRQSSAGEFELLDALNLMERGDYSSAIRRVTTAIEAQLEFILRQQLLKKFSPEEVEIGLKASENDFTGRLRQYLRLSKRKIPKILSEELNTTRAIRHLIVHTGLRISFNNRGIAQKAIDTGRWIFNWLENQPVRSTAREKRLGLRSLGRHFTLFDAEILDTGVKVHKPSSL
jgi:hypothetical protein